VTDKTGRRGGSPSRNRRSIVAAGGLNGGGAAD